MSDYLERAHSAVDPVLLAAHLRSMGYSIIYLDTDRTRLRHCELAGVPAVNMSEMCGKSDKRYSIAIAVNPSRFHTVNRIEWKNFASKQTIVIDA